MICFQRRSSGRKHTLMLFIVVDGQVSIIGLIAPKPVPQSVGWWGGGGKCRWVRFWNCTHLRQSDPTTGFSERTGVGEWDYKITLTYTGSTLIMVEDSVGECHLAISLNKDCSPLSRVRDRCRWVCFEIALIHTGPITGYSGRTGVGGCDYKIRPTIIYAISVLVGLIVEYRCRWVPLGYSTPLSLSPICCWVGVRCFEIALTYAAHTLGGL